MDDKGSNDISLQELLQLLYEKGYSEEITLNELIEDAGAMMRMMLRTHHLDTACRMIPQVDKEMEINSIVND
ncbi:hypothetical protein D4T97_010890 [Siminovitchia acidinfaciens]|uniref:Uncharacterized protein n=1 Tax=Siminovitchia acidinfaciens TaxID=2321395 RepID=A0A429XZG2_9BACI|nr:hypothetical protein [Siminovitchia acidinfaciens]RST74178.1 hypothetical protein D4T97_010890 [Siminovitchia acidinfaciens]